MTKPQEEEKLIQMYEMYNYRCAICGKEATQRAHILSDGKHARNKFGSDVIDSVHNWRPACGLKHNDEMALNYYAMPVIASRHAERVRKLEEENEKH